MTATTDHAIAATASTASRTRRALVVAAPYLAVLIVAALPFWGLWRAPGPPMEEGFMLVFPELVLEGLVPNRDFLHLYGPGSLWALAGVYAVFGVSLEVERAFAVVQQLGVAFGMVLALRPWGRWVATGGACMTAVVIIPPVGYTALAWTGAVALGLLAVVAVLAGMQRTGRGAQRFLVAAGLLASAALLFRPDLVLALGLAGAFLATRLGGRDRLRLGVATAAGLSLYVVHVLMAGVGPVVRGLFIEPVFDLRGGRRLPLPPSWSTFDGFLQLAGDTVAPPWPLPAPPSPAQLSLWLLLIIGTLVVLVVAGLRALKRGEPRLLALALFAAGLLPQALQRADSAHLAWVSCVPLGLLPAAVLELRAWTAPGGRRWSTARIVAAVAAPVVATLALVPHFTWRTYGDYVAQSLGYHRDVHTIEHRGRRFYYGRRDAVDAVEAMLPVVERIARPGESLFVGTGDLRKTPYSEAFLYHLLPQLDPATRYIEMDPGVANAPGSGLAEELASADIVILSSIRDDWVEPNDSRLLGDPRPNAVLRRDFCLVESFGEGLFGRGLYELYVKCS